MRTFPVYFHGARAVRILSIMKSNRVKETLTVESWTAQTIVDLLQYTKVDRIGNKNTISRWTDERSIDERKTVDGQT